MNRSNVTGCLLQLMGLAVGALLFLSYTSAGKDLFDKLQISSGAMEVGRIAGMLDREAASSDLQPGTNPYPRDYDAFCKLLQENTREDGDAAWKDRWGTAFYYYTALYNGKPGYCVASAGPDRKWRTEDDIWVSRWGDGRRTRNIGGEDEVPDTATNGQSGG